MAGKKRHPGKTQENRGGKRSNPGGRPPKVAISRYQLDQMLAKAEKWAKKHKGMTVDDFLLNLQTNNFSDETIYNYERDLNVFEDFLNSQVKIPFEKASKRTIHLYKAYLSSKDRKTPQNASKGRKKLSSYSINRMLSSLRSYLAYLIEIDYKRIGA